MKLRQNPATALLLGAAILAIAPFGKTLFAAPAATPQARVDAAYAAMGGDRLAALKTISLRAHFQQWDPGESYSVATPDKPDVSYSDLVQSRDLVRDLTRNEWNRPKNDDGGRRIFTEIVTPSAGWVVGNNASNGRTPKRAIMVDGKPAQTFSARRLTVTLRELERLDIVRVMKAHPDRVSAVADQTVDGKNYPAVQYKSDYGMFTVMFDPATNLPARIRTPDWDALEGDSVFDAQLSDWRDVAGAKLPFHAFYTLNGMKVADVTISNITPNPTLMPATFEIPGGSAGKSRQTRRSADHAISLGDPAAIFRFLFRFRHDVRR